MLNRINNKSLNTFVSIAAVSSALAVMFFATDPNHVPLLVLIVPFVLSGVLIYQLTKLFVNRYTHNRIRVFKIIPYGMSMFISLLLVLASLHQLTWRDGALTLLFLTVLLLYVWRADFLK